MIARHLGLACILNAAVGLTVGAQPGTRCAATFQQCGGQSHTGATACCASTDTCVLSNAWYSQCRPQDTSTGPDATAATETNPAGEATPTIAPAAKPLPGNPFLDHPSWYVNPSYTTNLAQTAAETVDRATLANLDVMKAIPSAFWLDVKRKAQISAVSILSLVLFRGACDLARSHAIIQFISFCSGELRFTGQKHLHIYVW